MHDVAELGIKYQHTNFLIAEKLVLIGEPNNSSGGARPLDVGTKLGLDSSIQLRAHRTLHLCPVCIVRRVTFMLDMGEEIVFAKSIKEQ